MTTDLAFFRDDADDETVAPPPAKSRETAVDAIARIALERALSPARRRHIARDSSHVLVVEVPSADWVGPIREACNRLRSWTAVFARTGSSRSEDVPSRGNEKVARTLSGGGAVLGVSHDCGAYLPSALLAADTRVRIDAPDDALVARAIRAVTGRPAPALPDRAAAGLSFWELAACIRGNPRACADRIAAAVRAKSIVDPGVAEAEPYENLLGYGAAHAWGSRLLRDLEAWRRDDIEFGLIDRNAVLASEPGLGKSTYVRSLAKAAKLNLIVSSVSSWFTSSNGYLDGVLKQVDHVFDQAHYASPTILFLDEIDSIPDRNSLDDRSRSWWTPVCTHILLRIDRLSTDRDAKVCLIGATNHAGRLDAALVRPGRLNRVIEIGRPTARDIAGIARQHLGDDLAGVDLRAVGELGRGATGAQVAGWIREARSMARAAERPMSLDDLTAVIAPADTRPDHLRRRSALHESAHAVGATVLGAAHVLQVDIVMRGEDGGSTSIRPNIPVMPVREDFERLVVSLLCGRAAEVTVLGEACGGSGGSADSDLGRATAIVARMHASLGLGTDLAYLGSVADVPGLVQTDPTLKAAIEVDLRRLHAQAERVVRQHRVAIDAVAERLLRDRVVDGDDVRAIVAKAEREAGR